MKLNWKIRFKNPVFVTSLCAFVISTIYQLLAMFEIAPAVTEDTILKYVASAIEILTLMGILVDPTTKSINDSERALGYEEPN